MAHNILITGSTGMVGKGVLYEALESNDVKTVYLINRTPIDVKHPKIIEILLKDFTQIESVRHQIEQLDACFHCMGVSALGLSEAQYHSFTYDITKSLADFCFSIQPNMTFIYVSGTGTDSSEKGSVMWARVKGKTENYILSKGFKQALMFRPGVILPEKGIQSKTGWYNTMYKIMRPFFPLMKKSASITTTTKIGQAMLHSLTRKVAEVHVENAAINRLAE